MTCEDFEPQLTAWVDGQATGPDAVRVEAHLETCPDCRAAAAAQRAVRNLLLAQSAELRQVAPPGLRTRIASRLEAESPTVQQAGWRMRMSAFAAAALVVLALGAAALPIITGQSTVVLAAQLALDHLKCFTIDGHEDEGPITVAEAQAELRRDYGWADLPVTPAAGSPGGQLVAVRRCLYGDGRAAHLLYRVNGVPVSLFILPGLERPHAELSVLGHDEVVWTAGGRTFMLVADAEAGLRHELRKMASNLRNGAQ